MPRGDGTGPDGMGAGTGRGLGFNIRGRNSGGAYGPGGSCICVKCGTTIAHQQGVSCTQIKCPTCGHTMVREELYNHRRKG